ncbi:hypothetical protein GUJ93_ZPchr0010g10915 [Zizania palustris]|uniref:Uncharacterized protein n=1 Tax=Zizania palustris TaxID=103762 RepID=A0A8J5W7G5_ZIZPA|nr:hypothetical protein GUJ93_ZPchr0010g10915 [Zizania palustris]
MGVEFLVEAARERGRGLAVIGGWWGHVPIGGVAARGRGGGHAGDWAMGVEFSVEAVRGRGGGHTAYPTGSRDSRGVAGVGASGQSRFAHRMARSVN